MVIEEEAFKLTPISNSSVSFNLELLYKILDTLSIFRKH